MKILLGVAGTSGLGYIKGLEKCKELSLDCLEVEFTYGVNMSNSSAKEIGELAKKLKIKLSIHCPYYINLASNDKKKISASIKRILDSCEKGIYMNEKIKKFGVVLCPETTGKKSQFGSLDELVKLSKETNCGICVDFAHLLARDGRIDYDEVLKKIKGVKNLTGHFSGIEYSEKGERRHVLTKEKDIEKLLKALKKHKISIAIINESPDPFGDAVKSKKILDRMK